MRELKFKYIYARNFFCFGPEGIEINFEKCGQIIFIKGENLDVLDNDGNATSNGAGKSSIIDMIVYALYGQTIKKPTKINHEDIINNESQKDLYVELHWDNYKVIRKRGTENSCSLFQETPDGWVDISVSGIPETQKEINKKIGLNYKTFINIFATSSDDPSMQFLEGTAGNKREMVENLLSLEKYAVYLQITKDKLKDLKAEIKILTEEESQISTEVENIKVRIKKIEDQERQWLDTKKIELKQVLDLISKKKEKLENSDIGLDLSKYREAQEQIKELLTYIPKLEEEKNKASSALTEGENKVKQNKDKRDKLNLLYEKMNKEYRDCKNILTDLEKSLETNKGKVGQECPYCFEEVKKGKIAKFIDKVSLDADKERRKLEKLEEPLKEVKEELNNCDTNIENINKVLMKIKAKILEKDKELSKVHGQISELGRIKEPKAGVSELLLQQEIETLKKQALDKKTEMGGISPHAEILKHAKEDLTNKEKELEKKSKKILERESLAPYYKFYMTAFGDKGIRKLVIDGIIPTLNSRIEYLLQYLVDNKIKLSFDSELNETIDRYPYMGRPYVYHCMSGGQRRRINLAISQAFAYIIMLNCGTFPSLVFLDEVTANLDPVGVECLYSYICELSKDKQVFVIDHNRDLLDLMNGCEQIKIQMKDAVTKRIN